MKRTIYLLSIAALALAAGSCVKQEALRIQGVDGKVDGELVNGDRYTEEYYKGVREWKKSPHVLSFGFFSAWHKLEGSYGEIDSPASYGQRLLCLPDSLEGKEYYHPTDQGLEAKYAERLQAIKDWKEAHRQ